MRPSIYQQQVIDWMADREDFDDRVVNSVAGSGKSTLLKLVADTIEQTDRDLISRSLVLVFNRKNKDALIAKLNPCWKNSISTVHSAGYRILRHYLGLRRLDVSEHKYRHLAKTLDWFEPNNSHKPVAISLSSFLKLADFVRQTLTDTSAESLLGLIEHYALDIPTQHLSEIAERLQILFRIGSELTINEGTIDHTDMLWLPVSWQVNQSIGFNYYQRVMVDEAQDLSRLQLEFVLSLTHARGKMLFVGDPAQSINGFCGADTDSFNNIKTRLQAEEFVLPICYRCPQTHIELINKLYPDIPIKPRDNAPTGKIEVIEESDLWNLASRVTVRSGDLIIARCSSSLIELHLKLIIRGIPCNLVGSLLKQELLESLEDIAARANFVYQDFPQFCQTYLEFKSSIYRQNDNGAVLMLRLQDLTKALVAIYQHFNHCQSVGELTQCIEQLFGTEDEGTVLLSTVHRAKGMEAERVYIAEPNLLPLYWENQKSWQLEQEHNLLYVALSRSTSELYLIGDACWFIDSKKNSVIETSNDLDLGIKIERIVSNASDEELEQYIAVIEREQGKRITQKFQQNFT